jgi:trehalose 2-sulfotransferase
MDEWAAVWNLPSRDRMSEREFNIAYLKAAIRAGKGATNVFGLRLMREYLEDLATILDQIFPGLSSDVQRFERAFGNILYIHLSRENKLAQAVSLVKAKQSGLWHISPNGTEIERLGAPRDLKYDFWLIQQQLINLEAFDVAWNKWFEQQDVTLLRVRYETLDKEPAKILSQICDALGVEAPKAEPIRPGLAKLADDVSVDWMRRFHADLSSAT